MESVSLQTQLDFNVFVTLDLSYPLINLVIIRLAVITFIEIDLCESVCKREDYGTPPEETDLVQQ